MPRRPRPTAHWSSSSSSTGVISSQVNERASCNVSEEVEELHLSHKDTRTSIEAAFDSVVKVFTTCSFPDHNCPWQKKSIKDGVGSGFIIEGQKIITNAHLLEHQVFVTVRKHGSPLRYRAKVQIIDPICDLAILTVRDKEFWRGMKFLKLGVLPFLQDEVAVIGYPIGGDNICITKGTVSKIEWKQCSHSATELMVIQVNASINSGNSGGPLIMDGKVVGVALQKLNADNIGYFIPVPIINLFLSGVKEKGRHVGFCSLGVLYQETQNVHLREHFHMHPEMTGVLVNQINHFSDAFRVLMKDDIIISIDDIHIANDGTVPFRNKERISLHHLVSMKKPGDKALLKVLRDGTVQEYSICLQPLQSLVPFQTFNKLPSYFIFAGLVFVQEMKACIHGYEYNSCYTSCKLCEHALQELDESGGVQIVMLSKVLMDDINFGYEKLTNLEVRMVNGINIKNLKQLCYLVEGCHHKYLRVDLEGKKVIVFNYRKAKLRTSRILEKYKISSAMSDDLIQ